MKSKIIAISAIAILTLSLSACNNRKGCTDPNANNYDGNADKNAGCTFRFASNIDVSNVPANRSNGTPWDGSDGPDLKLNFGKSSSSGYDFSTNTADNTTNATLTSSSSIKFTNENWKYELVDVDALGNEVITTGTFNPLQTTTTNEVVLTSNGVTIKFKYTIQ